MRIPVFLFVAACMAAACTTKPQPDVSHATPLPPGEPQPVLAHLNLLHPEEAIAPPLAISFGPSFLDVSHFVVLKDSAISMTIAHYEYVQWTPKIMYSNSRIFEITPSEWQSLAAGIALFNQHFDTPQSREDMGVDGVGMLIRSDRLAYHAVLHVWSPTRRREATYYYILDPLFSILRHHLTDEAEADYLKNLEQYFEL